MSRIVVITRCRGMAFPLDNNSLCIRAIGRDAHAVERFLPAELFIALYYSACMESLDAWMMP